VLFDADTRVRFWSPGAAELLGYPEAEALGRSGIELTHPDDRQRVLASFQTVLAAPGAVGRVQLRLRHRDGSFRLVESVARNLLHDPVVAGVVVNGRDVTAEARLTEQFVQAQKLESVGRLAGGVAHDFNNLLTVILSCAEGLRARLDEGAPVAAEDVDEIRGAAERAREVTRQLLVFARRQAVKPEPVDLNALVARTEKVLRRLLGEDVILRVGLEPELWRVFCDPGQLEQILLNLAVNARDAMPDGGALEVETANVPRDGGGQVVLRVRDTGVGMTAEVKAHLFEPFFTTKPPGRGTGLGLATVYGVVEQAGGFITVESEPGRGACFEVHLPRTEERAEAAAPGTRAAGVGGSETVLVVEDDPRLCEVMVRSLRGAGYRARSACGADEALAHASAPDLLLVDAVLPGPAGAAVARELRRRHPALRVLFTSGHPAELLVERGALAASDAFLPKPFTPTTLLEEVRRVLDARPDAPA
jgi:PAS domain S-box-containing protein